MCRRLGDAGASVSPVLTESATRFVGPSTFSALAAEPARTSLFSFGRRMGEPARKRGQRVTRARSFPTSNSAGSADAVVVAPATARLIGSYAAGISSDLLTSILLATHAPVLLCPAMHTEMWEHPAVQDNLAVAAPAGSSRPGAGRGAPGRWRRWRWPPARARGDRGRSRHDPGRWLLVRPSEPAASQPAISGTSLERADGPLSAPAGPGSRSTRSATSGTAVLASRATP